MGVVLNFEGLRKSIQASQMSNALKKAIGLSKGNTDEVLPVSSSNEKDQEEIEFIKDLLAEQNELNEKIMAVEKERLDSTVDLLYSKMEVAKEFLVTKQIYNDIITNEGQNIEDDEDMSLQRKIEKRKKGLAREEARLNQMKFVVQKLMASCPNNAMTFDEEANAKHYDMFLKCGQAIPEIRG